MHSDRVDQLTNFGQGFSNFCNDLTDLTQMVPLEDTTAGFVKETSSRDCVPRRKNTLIFEIVKHG